MASMTSAQLQAYLAEARIADLVTLREDGSPHVAPVWYRYLKGSVCVMAYASALKVRNILQDPRVAISISKHKRPYQYVVLEGIATVSQRDVDQTITDISVHYRGEAVGIAFARKLLEEGAMVVIKFSPTRTITWLDD